MFSTSTLLSYGFIRCDRLQGVDGALGSACVKTMSSVRTSIDRYVVCAALPEREKIIGEDVLLAAQVQTTPRIPGKAEEKMPEVEQDINLAVRRSFLRW